MKPLRLLLLAALALVAVGLTLAQELAGTSFQIDQEIGRALPQRMLYDPNFERFAIVDAYGQLLLMDALTYETEHILYTRGQYNDLAFSNDGRWLALAIGTRVELWDTATGEIAADLTDLSQARRIHGPLVFSPDDVLLLFSGTYPAPQALRRSENDTTEIPWLWHLPSAREEAESPFAGEVEALPFFDYRNGFVLGPQNRIVAALPGRLQVLDGDRAEVLYDIDTARYEQDPLTVGFSLRDNRLYVRPVEQNSLIQVDTGRGVLAEIPLDQPLTRADLEAIGGVELGTQARVIGGVGSREAVPLLRVLLGEDYRAGWRWGRRPLTVTLVDLIYPSTGTEDQFYSLLFIFDETQERGYFVTSRPYEVQQVALSPDGSEITLRRFENDERVEIYDLTSGELKTQFVPALRALGRYSRVQKNRVLAYDRTGEVILSDFQRFDRATGTVLAEDLRYSRAFDRFFFTDDNNIVTLSGSEWRLWDRQTGEVVRREVVSLRGDIIRTSRDGYRYLTQWYDDDAEGLDIVDVATGERRRRVLDTLPGRVIEQVIPSPDWEHAIVVYSSNSYGPYVPGNEVAIYGMDEGQRHFFAGDDLPPVYDRIYGWVDQETAYIYGVGYQDEEAQPGRVYGVEYAPNGLPRCLESAFPNAVDQWSALWDETLVMLDSFRADLLAQTLCDGLAANPNYNVSAALDAVRDPYGQTDAQAASPLVPTPVVIAGVPPCLTARYPLEAQAFADDWARLTVGLSENERADVAALLCEGLEAGAPSLPAGALDVTMLIDVETGARASGTYTPPVSPRPIQPIIDEFYRTEERDLGTVILSDDETLIAASSLPGELVVYRLVTPYRTLLDRGTATANAALATANSIIALPSPTPTPGTIGTPRPTLTPTVTPTAPPRPVEEVAQAQRGQVERLCPAEALYTPDTPPPDYNPTGRLIGPVQGDALWSINPRSGQRVPDEAIPPCGFGLNCSLSPDNRWILARNERMIFLVRPDGSDARVLFDDDPPEEVYDWPTDIAWSGANMLEWTVFEQVAGQPEGYVDLQFFRDEIGVFPEPPLWWPVVSLRGRGAQLIERQPGGPMALMYTNFSTGVGEGYAYWLVNTETGEADYFARLTDGQLTTLWHPLGDRLYYAYPTPRNQDVVWYQYTPATGTHAVVDDVRGGRWSPDGRLTIFSTNNRAQPVGVWDSTSGLVRTYCIPETGARLYDGSFYWAPDSRYVALQTTLPRDEGNEDIGQHVLVLDTVTGSVTDVTFGGGSLFMWAVDPGVEEVAQP